MIISLKNVKKKFGKQVVLNDLSLDIKEGEFLTIIGRSGEGKSVLLKHIIGLIQPDSGEIIIDGVDIAQKTNVSEKCGYVFQFAALLDSLNVFENIAIAQIENNESFEKLYPLVKEKLAAVGLDESVIEKYPNDLSGGMRKRVGLARTLMGNPKILLYDEPTTGLDPIASRLIHELIAKTHQEKKTTTIVISHNLDIFQYADSIAMLLEGKIVIKDAAKNVWDSQDPRLYQFVRGLPEGPLTKKIVL